jgi:hypothetical protein
MWQCEPLGNLKRPEKTGKNFIMLTMTGGHFQLTEEALHMEMVTVLQEKILQY